MLKTLLTHEILNLLKSKRVYWTVVMFILLYASVFMVRVTDFQKQINQYNADVMLAEEALQTAPNFNHIKLRAIRQPIIFSIFNEGFYKNRVVDIQYYEPITNTTTLNQENNKMMLDDTSLDITFLITFFLSLFILLISYDSVNGEKRVGTLRVLMTYPLKRQTFILKKILGVFIFVAVTFSIPYVISLITLMVIYANLLTVNFLLSATLYWFLVMLFIFFFSLLGIFISTCTTNPNRSLVYSLLVWMLFAIILPISWEFIISPKLYDDTINRLFKNYSDKRSHSRTIFHLGAVDETKYDKNELDIGQVNHYNFRGQVFYENVIAGPQETYDQHYRYQKYILDNYYPASREVEQARDEVYREYIHMENVRNWVFFFDPIVLFENLSSKITGNGRTDHLKFLHDSREVRDELVSQGVREGWLLDYRFFAKYKETLVLPPMEELIEMAGGDWDVARDLLGSLFDNAEEFEMVLPSFRRYAQPILTFGEVFMGILPYLVMFVVSILGLWVMTWQRFMAYDVR